MGESRRILRRSPTLREDRRTMGAHLRDRAEDDRARSAGCSAPSGRPTSATASATPPCPSIAVTLTTSATTVTVVAAATTMPFVLFGVLAGTLADRNARVPLIVRAHLFRAVVVAGMATLCCSSTP